MRGKLVTFKTVLIEVIVEIGVFENYALYEHVGESGTRNCDLFSRRGCDPSLEVPHQVGVLECDFTEKFKLTFRHLRFDGTPEESDFVFVDGVRLNVSVDDPLVVVTSRVRSIKGEVALKAPFDVRLNRLDVYGDDNAFFDEVQV